MGVGWEGREGWGVGGKREKEGGSLQQGRRQEGRGGGGAWGGGGREGGGGGGGGKFALGPNLLGAPATLSKRDRNTLIEQSP